MNFHTHPNLIDHLLDIMRAEEIHMQGGGYYNDNCILQRLAIELAFSVLDPIDFTGTTPFSSYHS